MKIQKTVSHTLHQPRALRSAIDLHLSAFSESLITLYIHSRNSSTIFTIFFMLFFMILKLFPFFFANFVEFYSILSNFVETDCNEYHCRALLRVCKNRAYKKPGFIKRLLLSFYRFHSQMP